MIFLGVDTSTPAGSVALVEGDRLLGEINLSAGGYHQERLLRCIDLLLDLTDLDFSRVNALSVGLGPGTFTGLRIGIATVKGLAVAQGIPAYGLSTLAALALLFRKSDLPIAPLIEAGRGEVYAALYGGGESEPAVLVEEQGGRLETFLEALPGSPVLFCGDGVRPRRDRIVERRGGRDRFAEEPVFLAGTLARWAAGRRERGLAWSLADLRPNYIRPPDAERSSR